MAKLIELSHPDYPLRKAYESDEKAKNEIRQEQKELADSLGDITAYEVRSYIVKKNRYVVRFTYSKKEMTPATMAVAKGPNDQWFVSDFNIDGQGEPELKQ